MWQEGNRSGIVESDTLDIVFAGGVVEQPATPVNLLRGIYALDRHTGALIWHRQGHQPSKAYLVKGSILLATLGRDRFEAIDASDGHHRWSIALDHNTVEPPWVIDSVMYACSYDLWRSETQLAAFDVSSGALLWKYVYESPGDYLGRRSVVQGDTCVCVEQARLTRVEHRTGRSLWRHELREPPEFAPAVGQYRGSATVYYGTREGEISALSGEDGAVLWAHSANRRPTSSPLVHDMDVLVGLDRQVRALRGTDGGLSWHIRLDEYRDAVEVATAPLAFLNDTVYIHLSDRYAGFDIPSGNVVAAYRPSTGVRTWQTQGVAGDTVEVIGVRDDLLYVAGDDVGCIAIDRASGRVRWYDPGTHLVAERAIFAVTSGDVRALDPADGTPVWTYIP